MLSAGFQKESELFTRAYEEEEDEEEEEEKAQEQGSPLLRTNPGILGLIWLHPILKMQPHDGIGKFSVNLYLSRAICAFFFDLRVEFPIHTLSRLTLHFQSHLQATLKFRMVFLHPGWRSKHSTKIQVMCQ